MASIQVRKNAKGTITSYRVRWREQGRNGPQEYATFETKSQAEMFKKVLELNDHDSARAESQILAAASRKPTLTEVAEMHLKRLTDIGEYQMHTYERMLVNHINPKLGTIPIDMITEEDLSDWVAYMKAKPRAPKTIANVHGFIHSVMKLAIRKGYRTDNPCLETRLPKADHTVRKTTFLTKGEFSLILEQVDEHFRPFLLFLVGTGLRLSEAAALQPEDFTHDGDLFTVNVNKAWVRNRKLGRFIGPPKTERGYRVVPMDRALALMVAPLVAKCPSDGYVFKMKQGGELTSQAMHHKVWGPARTAAKKKGLRKNPRIHDLRHTYASWMLGADNPISIFELSRLMGHESVNTTTKIYSHQMKESLHRGAAIMGDAMAELIAGEVVEDPESDPKQLTA